MALQIAFERIDLASARRFALGGSILPVTTVATAPGAQVTTPNVDGLVTSLRSEVWAAVDIAANPNPTGTAASIVIVGPGAPATVKGRKGLRISTVGTAAPGGSGGSGGVDLTEIRQTANDARDIAGQARQDVAAKPTNADLDAARSVDTRWTFPGSGGPLADGQTVFAIPGGYGSVVEVRIGAFEIDDFTAADGSTVAIGAPRLTVGDKVTITARKGGAVADAASRSLVDSLAALVEGAASKAALNTKLEASAQALALLCDTFPFWDGDPATYPNTPGLYRQGDANGYTLIRVLPKAS